MSEYHCPDCGADYAADQPQPCPSCGPTGRAGLPMETYLMTDQPPMCPQCGARVHIVEGAETNRQVCLCPQCHYRYRLEEDADEVLAPGVSPNPAETYPYEWTITVKAEDPRGPWLRCGTAGRPGGTGRSPAAGAVRPAWGTA